MRENSNTSGSIGFTGAVFLVFLVLKLLNKIDWSWWWVTSPLWIQFGLVVTACLVIALVAVGKAIWGKS